LLAVNSGDAEMIKQAQRNTALRRAGFKTPLHAKGKGKAREEREWNTPLREAEGGRSEWDEAVLSLDRDSALNSPTAFGAGDGDSEEEEEQQQPVVPKLSLDQFCQRYTSEDNESFGEVLAQANCRVREKRDRLFSSVKRLEGPPATQTTTDGDGYGSSNQPSANNLITWPHRPMNKLFLRLHPNRRRCLDHGEGKDEALRQRPREANCTQKHPHQPKRWIQRQSHSSSSHLYLRFAFLHVRFEHSECRGRLFSGRKKRE
jgi:hypothetical protein